ncbi:MULTISPECIES: Lrp/AsnC family transcriptional regulator [Halomonas]|uniref:AsnC family transcriptional regulator n=1 Tax=Halomonas halophila TaxID=29573 RepID=A0ABQ0U2T4_9GAMM|nr:MULTISPECIES: Lrp/AsnC family transcriptional regulator [Halomonas]MDR5889835.1 Lrp/AsnC family transcriptional regulator [Halomonas salina]WJY06762.1 Lrp/AsnC family transcriptional regulator [Halomonas halophila]GEK72854.1 AsnC family transcriptional regulator [Halomonas halophila]
MPLDKHDHSLLELLQQDCQTPLRELAETVHLSLPSVQRRIKKLKKEGYIRRNVAILEPEKLGQAITIIVEVKARKTNTEDLERLKGLFSGDEIQQCYYVTGETDFMLTILVSSMSRFNEMSDRLFHQNPDVESFRTIIVLDRVKDTLDVRQEGP